MDCIGLEEGKEEIDHSFDPEPWPDHVCQAPLTPEDEESIKSAWDSKEKLRRTPRTRRYLPCHYFDYVCGSSTGAYATPVPRLQISLKSRPDLLQSCWADFG